MLQPESDGLRPLDWFETESMRGRVLHVVKVPEDSAIPAVHYENDVLVNRRDSANDVSDEIRPVVPASRVRIARSGGLHLDIDIPPRGICTNWETRWGWAIMIAFDILWLIFTIMLTTLAYDHLKNGEFHVAQVVVIPCWIVAIWILYLILSKPFLHEYLQITATDFRFIRKFEPPCRPHVSFDGEEFHPSASFFDRMLFGQRSGQTADLGKAEIHEITKDFILPEGNRKLKFVAPLSATEQQWLVTEVNSVLADIEELYQAPCHAIQVL